ncbi:MAG: glycosyltransferase family 39 protein [Oligoflexia bacterium]|nr:glycosyltransferase family 39 protein [Oligoflexia bacterium]
MLNLRVKVRSIFQDAYLKAAILSAFVMVFMKKWEPGGNLDTIWYSAVAKNIYETGNWFHFFISKYYIKDIFDHMPLTYWATAVSFNILGPSDFSARLYPMLCSFVSYILLYKIGTTIKDRNFGLMTLFTHVICFGASKWNGALMHDVPLVTYYLATFYCFIKGLKQSKYFYGSAVFFALGVFTKGPIIFGFFLGVTLWTFLTRNWDYLKERHFYYALLLLMCILALPLLPIFSFNGLSAYTMFFLWKASYLASTKLNHYFAYFIVVTQTSTLTFIPFLISIFTINKSSSLSEYGKSVLWLSFFIAISVIVPLSFFSVKFPHYLLPFYPFLSIVATLPLYKVFDKAKVDLPKLFIYSSVIMLCVFAAIPIKTTGKRSKEVLNVVNMIKLDPDIKKKSVYFYGKYFEDMTIFQHFKFYGSIDLQPLRLIGLKDVDFSNAYIVINRRFLPLSFEGIFLTEENCIFVNPMYCVIGNRKSMRFNLPEYVYPHEIY